MRSFLVAIVLLTATVPLAGAVGTCAGTTGVAEVCAITGHWTEVRATHHSKLATASAGGFTVTGFAGQITQVDAQVAAGPAAPLPVAFGARVMCNDFGPSAHPCDQLVIEGVPVLP